uniref:Uncharacterized protein n=2 Tax=Beihai levi-like virus 14 TaxID=1922399 RepID=A0A1L3KI37_9VIRU|nr:hypothetical protein [Beihai levi-like virus 14]
MTKRNRNNQARGQLYMGQQGPVQSSRTTFGVNPDRQANARPVYLAPAAPMENTYTYLGSIQFAAGRHIFGEPASNVLPPQNIVPGVPTKHGEYVTTNTGDRLMASSTTVTRDVSNGRTKVSIDIPYYDRNAVETLKASAIPGAVAPVGSFKVNVEVLGGGVLTGTDANAQFALDELLSNMLMDAARIAQDGPKNTARLVAASHGVMPQA